MSAKLQADAASETTIPGFLRRQRVAPTPLPSDLRLTDQTAIVTGSNVGLGLSASRQLLELGLSHLVMGVRSQAKGDAAASQLRKDFPDSQVSVWVLDMESYESIRQFTDRCASLSRLEIVILNAGLMMTSYTPVAGTGHESTFQVNYLSTVYLSLLLVPILKSKKIPGASRPPVLSIVGSDSAYMTSLKTTNPVLPQCDDPKEFGVQHAYMRSKLLLMFFVAKLAELVDPSDVLINVSNPGLTKGTAFGDKHPYLLQKIFGVVQYFIARPLDVGASVYLDAVLVQGVESHGSFISEWTIKPFPPIWYTEEGRELGERLVEETMKELKPTGASLP
ncbi:retinol dehydrogenase 12 [Colletotrichum graminicola]|uniref:Retinol dehydrogenase 12 n=1 Tax=Colletotrichum graminicola (strain M1.001 / M2 / FGSC 10212) TaxID=645133 RepID=E3QKM8_COLGM|nr:retinol dehydrogenase 12 [Colletotrichum graminicola M1.001]EFQ31416.1 retinol dehydrogenase 12 [Colletotrichum graminicola M1.001]WDK19696.1 retinol dehydrogenase 12 [Colletotrichum graminicola]